ncbi:peptide ABC transporter substrate-binding protein [Micromonospora sp. PTRAS2]|uniref:peptide ABC transporter substrate-binding protein n=1 Tax=unclassified Micromonospora TaxID=2617518 RepID=UPI00098D6870|nr:MULTISPECIES: ABC transporter substrate-binding protein [unclassified Micromonospora]MDI5939580.1 ABC transporter substrate-binding protein [Micromonospora sp. DH15]OON29598.1 peptide ABC transporter substrate-binding protein [Micromonospora sp. Rc5]
MRVSKRASGAIALGAAFALVASGCSSSDGEGGEATSADGAITVDGTEPENPLVPSNTTETGGGKIIDWMWTGLVEYPNNGGAPQNALAESIETADSKVYKIKIKQDTKFHDGTVVKAKNFVDAWNWGAYSPNGAQNSSFFADIEGFADVNTADPDGPEGPQKAPEPKAKEMSGLKVVDDWNFEVTLAAPTAVFPTKLGYSTFMPLPDAFFSGSAEEFGKKPIGNGPVKFVSWENNVQIKLTRFDDYQLRDKMKVKDVTVKMYQEDTAAYSDLVSGNLDFMQQVPVAALAGDKWKSDLADRAIASTTPSTGIIAFPIYDKRFQNPKLRRAISLSINRQEITDKIFFGNRKPADSWANPLTPGAAPGNCTACQFNVDEAKKLLAEAGGFSGELVMYYNADASHKEWMEAVAQQVKTNLGINARAEGVPTFAVFRQNINAHKMKGAYRAGWQQDYPDVENWINPLYVTGGSSNDGLYSNKQVDALAKEASSAPSLDASHAKFAEAVKLIDQDVPSMPIYFGGQQSGHSEKIKKMELSNVGELDITSVEL